MKFNPAAALALARLLVPRQFELAQAKCKGEGPLFDLDIEGESRRARALRIERIRKICDTCPVIDACFLAATETPDVEGVWAGEVFLRGKREQRHSDENRSKERPDDRN